MPIYTYRREDGSRFEIRQGFHEPPLEVCPDSGQRLVRIVQPVGVVFKGSGFYVNDSKAVKSTNGVVKEDSSGADSGATSGENGASKTDSGESKEGAKAPEAQTKSEAKPAKQEASAANS